MDEYGQLSATEGETAFHHIPDRYTRQRECVRRKLDYRQSAVFSHTLYSDYYRYEIGDVIGIGNNEFSYFCFPKGNVSVTKARLATEELYKMKKTERRTRKAPAETPAE